MSISILMSVYHGDKASYLDRALSSIWIDQTTKPEQVVLIEDGKLGKELRVVIDRWKSLLNNRLTIVTNETNIGLTKSLNRGLKVATGTYIARMDSDDISTPNRLKLQAEYLDSHPDIMVVGGSLQEFDSENKNLNVREYPKTNEEVLNYIHKASPLAHPTVMMRREIFDNGLKYDERYRTSQDIALWFDVLAKGYKIANLKEITIKFRRDDSVFRRRSRDKANNELKIYMAGIYRLFGPFTIRYFYPIARYIFRLMPINIVKMIYGSKIRQRFLQK